MDSRDGSTRWGRAEKRTDLGPASICRSSVWTQRVGHFERPLGLPVPGRIEPQRGCVGVMRHGRAARLYILANATEDTDRGNHGRPEEGNWLRSQTAFASRWA